MAIKLNPDCAEAYNSLGAVLFHVEMTEEAIGYFKKATRIRSGFAAAQKNLEIAISKLEKQ